MPPGGWAGLGVTEPEGHDGGMNLSIPFWLEEIQLKYRYIFKLSSGDTWSKH